MLSLYRKFTGLLFAFGLLFFFLNIGMNANISGLLIAALMFGPSTLFVLVVAPRATRYARRTAERDSYAKNDWRSKV
jgi:hypothetical protein